MDWQLVFMYRIKICFHSWKNPSILETAAIYSYMKYICMCNVRKKEHFYCEAFYLPNIMDIITKRQSKAPHFSHIFTFFKNSFATLIYHCNFSKPLMFAVSVIYLLLFAICERVNNSRGMKEDFFICLTN